MRKAHTGKTAFLGGPLHFLPELRKRFIETLELKDDQVIVPENSQLFVAVGAAISASEQVPVRFGILMDRLNRNAGAALKEIPRLLPFSGTGRIMKISEKACRPQGIEAKPR